MSNAIKFTPEKGNVALEVSSQETTTVISVINDGIGVGKQHQAEIFESFRQIDSAYNRRFGGTGLGLSLTKRLVELHGGRLWLKSEGKGTRATFSFTLPNK